jgi:hypothetical protein
MNPKIEALLSPEHVAEAVLAAIEARPGKRPTIRELQLLNHLCKEAKRNLEREAREAGERERQERWQARKREIEAERQQRHQEWLERQLKLEAEVFPKLEEAVTAIRAGAFGTLKELGEHFGWTPELVRWMPDAAARRSLMSVAEFYGFFPRAKRKRSQ